MLPSESAGKVGDTCTKNIHVFPQGCVCILSCHLERGCCGQERHFAAGERYPSEKWPRAFKSLSSLYSQPGRCLYALTQTGAWLSQGAGTHWLCCCVMTRGPWKWRPGFTVGPDRNNGRCELWALAAKTTKQTQQTEPPAPPFIMRTQAAEAVVVEGASGRVKVDVAYHVYTPPKLHKASRQM